MPKMVEPALHSPVGCSVNSKQELILEIKMNTTLKVTVLTVAIALFVLGIVSALTTSDVMAGPVKKASAPSKKEMVERGRYLIKISGCNDCHTPGYGESGGQLPESEWLTGMPVGFRGPWGVTYPVNLRTYVSRMTEDEWTHTVRTKQMAPPMPWFALHDMTEEHVRAIYQFITSLGSKGEEMPARLAPGEKPSTPVIDFVPHQP
jgi:mono/diheme cytochrome c family protein